MLSELKIRAELRKFDTSGPRRKLHDGGGLYLLLEGTKTPGWRLRYRVDGREKLISFVSHTFSGTNGGRPPALPPRLAG